MTRFILLAATFLMASCAAQTAADRGLAPTEINDGGLRIAPPPPEDPEFDAVQQSVPSDEAEAPAD